MSNSKGFTLIEMMIVVVIIGILASIAYPSYQEHVRRSNRAEGQAFLNDIAARQERYFAQNNLYVVGNTAGDWQKLGLPDTAASTTGRYEATLAGGDGGYLLTASPTFPDPRCGDLTLNGRGVRGVSVGDSSYCWR